MADAAAIALGELVQHLASLDTKLREAIFVLYDRRAYDVHAGELARLAPSRT
jgi:hypothetical protein